VEVLPSQLAVRNLAELGNNVPPFVGAIAPGDFFHNPVQQNIWVRVLFNTLDHTISLRIKVRL
jgi:hypothetical protein